MPSSGLWEQAEPGWRTAADMQRVEAWRAETNDRREGIGSPDALRTSVSYWMLPVVNRAIWPVRLAGRAAVAKPA